MKGFYLVWGLSIVALFISLPMSTDASKFDDIIIDTSYDFATSLGREDVLVSYSESYLKKIDKALGIIDGKDGARGIASKRSNLKSVFIARSRMDIDSYLHGIAYVPLKGQLNKRLNEIEFIVDHGDLQTLKNELLRERDRVVQRISELK